MAWNLGHGRVALVRACLLRFQVRVLTSLLLHALPCSLLFLGLRGLRAHLPDFGKPSLRAIYAETSVEVEAIDEGLRAVAHCPLRIVLLHYAPLVETLEGERREIWAFLGTDRLAAPIVEHAPDLVLHGHAHGGSFRGTIGDLPVFNVSVPVIGTDFWRFELTAASRPREPMR